MLLFPSFKCWIIRSAIITLSTTKCCLCTTAFSTTNCHIPFVSTLKRQQQQQQQQQQYNSYHGTRRVIRQIITQQFIRTTCSTRRNVTPSNKDKNELRIKFQPQKQQQSTKALLVLASVPIAWGTFEVAVRYVYTLQQPSITIPSLLFSLAYYAVATLALLGCTAIGRIIEFMPHLGQSKDPDKPCTTTWMDPTTTTTSTHSLVVQSKSSQDDSSPNSSITWPYWGGFELGTYLFIGNLFQLIGLQTVASDRAAFLLQLTTIFVPMAQCTLVDKNWGSIRLWVAGIVALIGVAVMGLDSPVDDNQDLTITFHNQNGWWLSHRPLQNVWWSNTNFQWHSGDTLIVLAAIAYTFHCIRLERYAQQTMPIPLATCKATTEMMWSAFLVGIVFVYATITSDPTTGSTTILDPPYNALAYFVSKSGHDCSHFVRVTFSGVKDGTIDASNLEPAVLAVLWTGLVPVAYTIFAQSYGQQYIRPVTANIIYTVQPIWTALFAFCLLGERLTTVGYIGGALIGIAVLLVVTPKDSN